MTDQEKAVYAKVTKKLVQICKQRGTSLATLASRASVSESTIRSLWNQRIEQRKKAERVLNELGKCARKDWQALAIEERQAMQTSSSKPTVNERWEEFSNSLTDQMKEYIMQLPSVLQATSAVG